MSEISAPFKLTDAEKTLAVWKKIEDHYTKRLAYLRKANDNSDMTELKTATLRGQIKEVKAILALADELPAVPEKEPIDTF